MYCILEGSLKHFAYDRLLQQHFILFVTFQFNDCVGRKLPQLLPLVQKPLL